MKNIVKKVTLLSSLGAIAMLSPEVARGASTTTGTSTATVGTTCPIAPTKNGADLCISSFTLSATSPIVGANTTATIAIQNWGTKNAGRVTVRWSPDLKTNKADSTKAKPQDLETTVDVPEYKDGKPGTITPITFSSNAYVLPPDGTTTTDTQATVDPDNKIAEKGDGYDAEGNNILKKTVTLLAPDLVISGYNLVEASPTRENNVTAQITVKNQGTAPASNFYVRWIPNLSSGADVRDVFVAGPVNPGQASAPINVGSTTDTTKLFNYPSSTISPSTAVYTSQAWVNAAGGGPALDKSIAELNNNNNFKEMKPSVAQHKMDMQAYYDTIKFTGNGGSFGKDIKVDFKAQIIKGSDSTTVLQTVNPIFSKVFTSVNDGDKVDVKKNSATLVSVGEYDFMRVTMTAYYDGSSEVLAKMTSEFRPYINTGGCASQSVPCKQDSTARTIKSNPEMFEATFNYALPAFK